MGDRHGHFFLLYVLPKYRRQGIGAALMNTAENYAQERGDRQITLQVFESNQTAKDFYQNLDYQAHSIMMKKSLNP